MNIRDLRLVTAILTALIILDALWVPIVLTLAHIAPGFFQLFITPIAAGVDTAAVVVRWSTMIVFSCWIYVAGRNLVAAGVDGLEFTPGARVWWFAVPVAALFKPFQGMRELYNASRGTYPYETSTGLVELWWGLWLLAGFGRLILSMVNRNGDGSVKALWLSSGANCALAVVAILLLHRVARAQRGLDGSDLSEVFA